MDDADGLSGERSPIVPFLALAALVLLPFLGLSLFGDIPSDPQDRASVTTVAAAGTIDVADLPATADDTVVTTELDTEDAQARNAAVEFASVGPGTARPFRFAGSSADRTRARDCLALAGMAEAGGGDGDQRAVMQVVLNRVRHPAFAKTICGVVFEGSQRPTGCQFSFTCDGSLARRYSDAAWRQARARADAMLQGGTEASVGNATHFHADYVYPWWSNQLDKVAKVGPHIFFRWRGFWGTRHALSARYGGNEPDPMRLRETAMQVASSTPLPTLMDGGEPVRSITSTSVETAEGGDVVAAPKSGPGAGVHFVLVSNSDSPAALVERARGLCAGGGYCRVQGWTEAAHIPARLPLAEDALRTLRFSFVAATEGTREIVFFDCRTFPPNSAGTCLPARP